jgi:hypothetical protein
MSTELHLSWKTPLFSGDTRSISIYRHDGEVSIEEMPQSGEKIFETGEIYSGYHRDTVGRGDWYYAIFAENRKGLLCPGAIKNYLTLDAEMDIINLKYIKGILYLELDISGIDISSWQWYYGDNVATQYELSETSIVQQINIGSGPQKIIIQGRDENLSVTRTLEYYLDIFSIKMLEDGNSLKYNGQSSVSFQHMWDEYVEIVAPDPKPGYVFDTWDIQGLAVFDDITSSTTNIRIMSNVELIANYKPE